MSRALKDQIRKHLDMIREGNVIQGPWTGAANDTDGQLQKVDVRQMFGGPEYNIITDLGYNFMEKPSYFNDIKEPYVIPHGEIARVERAIGRRLQQLPLEEMIEPYHGDLYPQMNADFERADDETIILYCDEMCSDYTDEVEAGDLFLANRTGAKRYYRMWMRIV